MLLNLQDKALLGVEIGYIEFSKTNQFWFRRHLKLRRYVVQEFSRAITLIGGSYLLIQKS
jgi:hypothetical protein